MGCYNTDHSFVIISDRELALMNAIDNVFPSARNLLCVWHIEKNVVSNCKGFFEHAEDFDIFMSNWNNIVYSTTEDMFVNNWDEFELLYREKKDTTAQYEKITKGTISPCTGHFTATMGLPCAHKIINSHENKLSLDLIHSHWRIDTLTLDPKDVSNNDGANPFVKLLDELNEKYQAWPLHKNETATLMITNLINQSDTLFEPLIQRPRGRPLKAKKKKGTTSTAQNPSRFEYVESLQKHNPSTSASVVQMSNEVTNEVSYIHHENNMIDLNLYLDFLSDDDTYVVRSFQVKPTRILARHRRQNGVCSHGGSTDWIHGIIMQLLYCLLGLSETRRLLLRGDDDTYVVRSFQVEPTRFMARHYRQNGASSHGGSTDLYQPCETDPYLGKASPSKWCLQPWRVESPLPGPGDLFSRCGLQKLKAVLSMRHVMKVLEGRAYCMQHP
ncbi:protein FAR1-related sequence 5 [Tanacetum coccineum]